PSFPPSFSLAPLVHGISIGGVDLDPGPVLQQISNDTGIGQGAQNPLQGLPGLGQSAADAAVNAYNTAGDLVNGVGKAITQAVGFIANGHLSVGITGSLNISIPDRGSTPGRLTAPEILNILESNPLALIDVQPDFGVSFSGQAQLLGQNVGPVNAF